MELEGLDTRNVAVGFDPAYPELGELAALFDFRPLPVFNTTSYNGTFKRILVVFQDMICVWTFLKTFEAFNVLKNALFFW